MMAGGTAKALRILVALLAVGGCSSSSPNPGSTTCGSSATGVYVVNMDVLTGWETQKCPGATNVVVRVADDSSATVVGAPSAPQGTSGTFSWGNCTAQDVLPGQCPQVVHVTCDPAADGGLAYSAFFDLFLDANGNLVPCSADAGATCDSDSYAEYQLGPANVQGLVECYWGLSGKLSQ